MFCSQQKENILLIVSVLAETMESIRIVLEPTNLKILLNMKF